MFKLWLCIIFWDKYSKYRKQWIYRKYPIFSSSKISDIYRIYIADIYHGYISCQPCSHLGLSISKLQNIGSSPKPPDISVESVDSLVYLGSVQSSDGQCRPDLTPYRLRLCSHDVSKTDMERQAPDTQHQAPYIPDTCFVCYCTQQTPGPYYQLMWGLWMLSTRSVWGSCLLNLDRYPMIFSFIRFSLYFFHNSDTFLLCNHFTCCALLRIVITIQYKMLF